MTDVPEMPAGMLEKIESINKNLRPYDWREGNCTPHLVPYKLDDGRHDSDWRCHLVDAEDNTLASYLQWEHLEWHTVRMFLDGFIHRRKIDFEAGQRSAVNKLREQNLRLLGLSIKEGK